MSKEIKLPPLPFPEHGTIFICGHAPDDEKLLAWGRAAVEADRQRRMPSDEEAAQFADDLGVYYDQEATIAGNHARAPLSRYGQPAASAEPFQDRVQPWLIECFGPMIAGDREERNHRFLEEALELVQSCGCTASEAHQLVDYVFGRPVGEPSQEVGGVMVTLAALCLANNLDMHADAEKELARINAPDALLKIRAKQAAKPKHSPLPISPVAQEPVSVTEHWQDGDDSNMVLRVDTTAPVAANAEPETVGRTTKKAWWAGYRAGKGVPADMHRQEAAQAAMRCPRCGEGADVSISSAQVVTHRPDGAARDERDIASDPEGKLIHDPSEPLLAAPVAAQASVPDGWQVVPKVPTEEMLEAGMRAICSGGGIYRAMLEAAPTPTADGQTQQDADKVDAERLDWLEEQTRKSATGTSFDYGRLVEDGRVVEHGYRFMRLHFLGERKASLRAAIDAARATPVAKSSRSIT